jgi:hypothetical protein
MRRRARQPPEGPEVTRLATWVAGFVVAISDPHRQDDPGEADVVAVIDLAEGRIDVLRAALQRIELSTELESDVRSDAHRMLLAALARRWAEG